jgi:hypothetical protein
MQSAAMKERQRASEGPDAGKARKLNAAATLIQVSMAGVLCLLVTMLWPLILSFVAWPDKDAVARLCWLANTSSQGSYSVWNYASNLLLAPALEALPLMLIFRFLSRGRRATAVVGLYGFLIHGLSIISFGKAAAFVVLYRISTRGIEDRTHSWALFFRLGSIHFVWNAFGMLFSMQATRLCG